MRDDVASSILLRRDHNAVNVLSVSRYVWYHIVTSVSLYVSYREVMYHSGPSTLLYWCRKKYLMCKHICGEQHLPLHAKVMWMYSQPGVTRIWLTTKVHFLSCKVTRDDVVIRVHCMGSWNTFPNSLLIIMVSPHMLRELDEMYKMEDSRPLSGINAVSMCPVWHYGINYQFTFKTAILPHFSRCDCTYILVYISLLLLSLPCVLY